MNHTNYTTDQAWRPVSKTGFPTVSDLPLLLWCSAISAPQAKHVMTPAQLAWSADRPGCYSHWMPGPTAPRAPTLEERDDAAWDAWAEQHRCAVGSPIPPRDAWRAGIAHARQQSHAST